MLRNVNTEDHELIEDGQENSFKFRLPRFYNVYRRQCNIKKKNLVIILVVSLCVILMITGIIIAVAIPLGKKNTNEAVTREQLPTSSWSTSVVASFPSRSSSLPSTFTRTTSRRITGGGNISSMFTTATPKPLVTTTSKSQIKDCSDIPDHSGSVELIIDGDKFQVECQDGWTVMTRRIDGTASFYRTWRECKEGFGQVNNELYVGNELMHRLTNGTRQYMLYINMTDWNRTHNLYAFYGTFRIGSEEDLYRIYVGNYSGDAGDALTLEGVKRDVPWFSPRSWYIDTMPFQTKDSNHTGNHTSWCSRNYKTSWWFNHCGAADLHGPWGPCTDRYKCIRWGSWPNINSDTQGKIPLREALMLIGPVDSLHLPLSPTPYDLNKK